MAEVDTDFFNGIETVPFEKFNENPRKYFNTYQPKICAQNLLLAEIDTINGKEIALILIQRAKENKFAGELVLAGGKLEEKIPTNIDEPTYKKILNKEAGREATEEINFDTKHSKESGFIPIEGFFSKPLIQVHMFCTTLRDYNFKTLTPQESEVQNIYAITLSNLFNSIIKEEPIIYARENPTLAIFPQQEGLVIAGKQRPATERDLIKINDDVIDIRGRKLIPLANSKAPEDNEIFTIRDGGIIVKTIQQNLGKDTNTIQARVQQSFNEAKASAIDKIEIIEEQKKGR